MDFYFLMCSERSGSNLLTKIFNSHPQVVGPSTKHIINPLARNLFRYDDLTDENNWRKLLFDVVNLLNVKFSEWKTNFTIDLLLEKVQSCDPGDLIKFIFESEAKANKKDHVFIKENQLYEYMHFIEYYFPHAKYIYLTRDPRDMALSWKKSSIFKGGVISAANQWKKDQQNFLKYIDILKKSGKSIHISYEKLLIETEMYLNKICQFLGLKYSSQMLSYHTDDMTIRNSKKILEWQNLSNEVLKHNFLKYEMELSEDEIFAIESICFYEMRFLGYDSVKFKEGDQSFSAEKLNSLDLLGENYTIPEPVRLNMQAKKCFYQR